MLKIHVWGAREELLCSGFDALPADGKVCVDFVGCEQSDCMILTIQMLRIGIKKHFLFCSMISSEMGHNKLGFFCLFGFF